MQGSRLPVRSHELRAKPRLVLDSRFPFAKTLEVGDVGQLDTVVQIDTVSFEPDENGDDRMNYVLLVKEAEIIDNNEARL